MIIVEGPHGEMVIDEFEVVAITLGPPLGQRYSHDVSTLHFKQRADLSVLVNGTPVEVAQLLYGKPKKVPDAPADL